MKSPSLLLLVGLIIGITSVFAPLPRQQKPKISLKALYCSADNASISDLICIFKPVRNKFGNFTLDLTFVNPVANLLVDVQSYIKRSANSYSPSAIHFTQSMCGFDLSPKSVMMIFLPSLRDVFSKLIQNCPYKGRVLLKNYVLNSVEDTFFLKFTETHDFKIVFQFIDADKKKTIMQADLLGAFRGASLNFLTS